MTPSRYKMLLYFFLAVLPAIAGFDNPPANGWEAMKFVTLALYQGLLAMKAFQSNPNIT